MTPLRPSPGFLRPKSQVATAMAWIAFTLTADTLAADPPKRLSRAESFLGIHFDFHAGPDCTEVGKNTTPEMVEQILQRVRPDYLQIDCKGHPGYCSYPTQVGKPVPGFVGDPLRVWRDVTARHGVGLFLHYSGVWDSQAALNPGWAAIDAQGKPSTQATSFFGPYAEKLLIPQLRELAGDYGIDGVWVDGECWASVPDYGPTAIEAFQKATGFQEVPRKPGEPHWFEFLQFHREAFRQYLRHYITEVKKTHPQFQMCSNWAYTDHMAEPVSAPVDFLSGDYSPEDSVNSARLSGRFLVRQGKPWDLMAWSFTTRPGRGQKSAVQLQREAAVVVALGGGFQAYHKQKRDGSIFPEQMVTMGEVAKFCRDRQALCHHAMPVPQVAVLLSTAGHYRRIHGLFNRDLGSVHGALEALLESQYSVEVVAEHQIAGRLAEYPVLVIPEWEYLEPAFGDDVVTYVRNGGSLVLIGPRSTALFQEALGLSFQGSPRPATDLTVENNGTSARIKSAWQPANLGPQATALGRMTASGTDPATAPAAAIMNLGKGRVAATFFNLGRAYKAAPTEDLRQFLNELVRRVFDQPMVQVEGSRHVDVSVARKDGRLLVNLVNTSGPHRTEPILNAIDPVGPLQVGIRLAQAPSKVSLEPGGNTPKHEFRDGLLRVDVPKLEVHQAVVITP